MKITSVVPQKLYTPVAKPSVAPVQEKPASAGDAFVPSGEKESHSTTSVLYPQYGTSAVLSKVGLGIATGALAGAMGQGSFGMTAALGAGLNGTVQGVAGAGVGSMLGKKGAIAGGAYSAIVGSVSGLLGGLATAGLTSLVGPAAGNIPAVLPSAFFGGVLGGLANSLFH